MTVTVDPFEPSEPPLGVWLVTMPGRLIGVLVDPRDAEARALELGRRLVVRQADDVRER